MNLFQELKILFPYLISIRKLKNYLSFDISLPATWKLPKKFVNEEQVVEMTSEDPNTRALSFITSFEESVIKSNLENIKNLIKYNKELEAKEKLFEDKVNELKSLFDGESLEKLRTLAFEMNKKTIKLLDEEPKST